MIGDSFPRPLFPAKNHLPRMSLLVCSSGSLTPPTVFYRTEIKTRTELNKKSKTGRGIYIRLAQEFKGRYFSA